MDITQRLQLLEKAEDCIRDAERAQHNYLRKSGWDYTSDTPGCYWMWQKQIGERVVLVGTETAIGMQEALDRRDPAHPDNI